MSLKMAHCSTCGVMGPIATRHENCPSAPSAAKCGCSVTQGAVSCPHGNLIEASPRASDERAFLAGRKGMVPAAEVVRQLEKVRDETLEIAKHLVTEAIRNERERIIKLIEDKRSWYAEDIFSPLTAGEKDPVSRDRVSAHMARHICTLIISDILNPSEEGK